VEAREVFSKEFCRSWNKGKLPDMYYQGIPPDLRRSLGRSSHTWSLALTDSERDTLNDLSDSVRDVTAGKGEEVPSWGTGAGAGAGADSAGSSSAARERRQAAPRTSAFEIAGNSVDRSQQEQRELSRDRYQREDSRTLQQQQQQRLKALAEELAPRAMGGSREAQQDKKNEIAAATHGAFLTKTADLDVMLSDADIYGGSGAWSGAGAGVGVGIGVGAGGNRSLTQKQRQQQEERAQLRVQAQVHQQDRDAWRDKLGIDFSAGKITIAPRDSD